MVWVLMNIIERALEEDIKSGDITTNSIIPSKCRITARIVAKQSGILAGIPVAQRIFRSMSFVVLVQDGAAVQRGQVIAEIKGSTRFILSHGRTALNFLQHLSGIATLTKAFVDAAGDVKILDTRKTVPGLRRLQKYAVRVGGGQNHRMGLFDMVLIKKEHVHIVGSITEAVRKARLIGKKIEVEVSNLIDIQEAIRARPDIIMLDNMSIIEMKKAVKVVDGRIPLEVSGNVTLGRLSLLRTLDVQYISVGALTHSAPALDISMEVQHECKNH
ncbi:carboxylating nicotinate-nucleotide diphosphorylase [Candidatus Woesearchaeota archaeon]|nr:carboxylating nicotinate-nucleotide diphosphorylase [Candidatus Woesearchaeota archaeon]